MPLDALDARIPAYASDLSLNLSALLRDTTLDDSRKWGALLACAHAVGTGAVIRAVEAEVVEHMTPEAAEAARTAAALMAMTNVYFRAVHLMHTRDYEALPSRLRMNAGRNPGAPKVDYELWALAVSAINGCAACLDAHETTLREHGVMAAEIQAALRIAAVVHAIGRVLAAEDARQA